VGARPELIASRVRSRVEVAVGAVVGRVVDGSPEVVAPIRRRRAVRLLRIEAGASQVRVGESRNERIADDRRDGGTADPYLAVGMIGGPDDGARGDIRLEDRRHRLRAARQPALDPAELRRVQGRHLHHDDAHVAAVVQELAAQSVLVGDIHKRVHLKYEGTDTSLAVPLGSPEAMRAEFEKLYRARFSFLMPERRLVAEAVAAEAVGRTDTAPGIIVASPATTAAPAPVAQASMTTGGVSHDAPVYQREKLPPGTRIAGPAIIAERNATTVVECLPRFVADAARIPAPRRRWRRWRFVHVSSVSR